MNGCEFIRVVTKDDEECFLLTKLNSQGRLGFEMTLCHEGKVWTGTVSKDDLDSMSTKVKMNFNQFITQTMKALTTAGEGKDDFQYRLKPQKDMLEFHWLRHLPAENTIFQLGCMTMRSRSDSAQLITKIFHSCVETMQEVKSRILCLETDNQRLLQEQMNVLKRLEKCVVAQGNVEKDHYSKFSEVVSNCSKKNKVKEFKQRGSVKRPRMQADYVDHAGSDLNKMLENKPCKKKRCDSVTHNKTLDNDSLFPKDDLENASSSVVTRNTRKPFLHKNVTGANTKSSENLGTGDLLEEL